MAIGIPTWAPHRVALLSVWTSIYLSSYLYFVSAKPLDVNDPMLFSVLVSVAIATVGVGLFKLVDFRNILFSYFDWIAGKRKANWVAAVVLLSFFIYMLFVSIY